MYVQSESISETYGSVKLSYEHCIETSTIEEGCADQNTTEEFWRKTQFFVKSLDITWRGGSAAQKILNCKRALIFISNLSRP